ncbi:MAG: glycosyltransferase family 2 protein [Patescibacteria group bacterium]
MKHTTISLCMITLNEEEFIGRSIRNAKPYVDEIIVLDGGSTDRTVQIAKPAGAQVFHAKWPADFAKQRNRSLKYATKDWILVMDADEFYEKSLLEKLQTWSQNTIGVDMFAFPRKNYLDGKQTDAYPDRQMRFFPNYRGIKYVNKVHEKPVGYELIASPMKSHIIHKKTSLRQQRQNALYKTLGA